MTEVEIFWPASLPASPAHEAEAALRQAGIEATCRLQPVRRGAESVLVLLTNSALEPVLGAVFSRLSDEVWHGLAAVVARLLKHTAGHPAPKVVIFESAASGAQFVFTSDLPEDAFRKAIEIDPGTRPGRWMWDQDKKQWIRFEDR